MKRLNLLLAFGLELVMLGAWAWKGWSLPLPPPLPDAAAALLPLFVIVVWGLFAAPRARFPLPLAGTVTLKALLLGLGAFFFVSVGQPLLGAVNGLLIVMNLVLAVRWKQLDRPDALRETLERLLYHYGRRHPEEAQTVERFLEFLASGEALQGKINPKRHITASTWIVNPDRSKVLLTHHAKLNKWVQLGGHTDEGEDWAGAALREAQEESGLPGLQLASDELFDLDIHEIPARGATPAHDHYDLRFLIVADDTTPVTVSEESHDLAWVALEDMGAYTSEESQLRMKRKTRSAI